MWIFVILIVVAVILFRNYNSDKKELHSRIEQKGGMDRIFQAFINYIEDDFKAHRIILNSNTELEISATTYDGKTFYFGIKLGFGDKVIYRCDIKRSSVLNADIAVEGNKSEQVAPYMMILDELRKKYSFITNDEQIVNERNKSESIKINSPLVSTKYSHLKSLYTRFKMISTSNTQCTIFLDDFTELKFDVIDFKIGDLNDKSILEKTTDIDTSMYLMVFNKEGIELELDQTFNVYLDCSDNTECIMTF